jgi:hypothetical protein
MPFLVGYVTPQDYGAAANGTTDDTTAVQNAINAVFSAGGGTLFFPEGNYKITAALVPKDGVSFLGVNDTASVITQTSTTLAAIAGVDANNIDISNLGITGPGSGSGNGVQFTLSVATSTPYITMRNVTIKSFGGDGVNINIPIVSNFTRVVAQSCGGYGFNLFGTVASSGSPGTSATLTSCYAVSCTTGGYRLFKTSYFSLTGCAVDTSTTGIGYLIDQGWCNSLIGCGSEGNGTGIKINAGYGNSVMSQFVYNNLGIGIWVTGTAHLVGLYQVVDVTPGGGATHFIQVDSGSFCTIVGQSNTTSNLLSGTVNILDDGAGGVDVPGYTFISNTLEIGGTHNILVDSGSVQTTGATSGTVAQQASVSGDTQPRYQTLASGTTNLGPGGSTATDTVYGRSAAGVLYTSKNFLVGSATALGDNGVGEVQLANATTAPTTNPTGGVVHYGANGTSTLQRDTAGHLSNLSWSDENFQMNGFTARNMDPNYANSNNLCTTTTINLHRIYVPTTVTTTTVFLYVSVIGATLTSGQNLVGLYNAAGTRVAVTADQSANWTSTGLKTISWASSFAIPSPGVYYVAILSNGTTPATFAGSGGFSGLYNANTTGASLVHADGPTAQTTMPSSITMSSNTSSAKSIFVAIV